MAQPTNTLPCFKAYDVRGRVPDELNEDLAYRIGRAYAHVVRPKRVVVGFDIRLSSPGLARALTAGLTHSAVKVISLGQCGTEEVYFGTFHLKTDGGIMVTASHNPRDYNGMKFVRDHAKPISGDTGLRDIEKYAAIEDLTQSSCCADVETIDIHTPFVQHLLTYVDVSKLPSCVVVANAGNGGAGAIIDLLEPHLPIKFVKVHHEPDGTFPNGVPNPLLPENRGATTQAILESKAAIGIAWDGDFDRCFLFDNTGRFIEGYYIVGLLASRMLARQPGATIIHDPRLTWNTRDIVMKKGGKPIQSKTGHAFIKERMRREDAIYGGEMSAHHYFKQFSYCDSGMIPWLLVLAEMAESGMTLAELIDDRMLAFPASGEINRRVSDPSQLIADIKARYAPQAKQVDETDGVSIEFDTWRFNLRMSNTEPVVRLNVEARGSTSLMEDKTQELLRLMDAAG